MNNSIQVVTNLSKLYDKSGAPLKGVMRILEYLGEFFEADSEEHDTLINIACELLKKKEM